MFKVMYNGIGKPIVDWDAALSTCAKALNSPSPYIVEMHWRESVQNLIEGEDGQFDGPYEVVAITFLTNTKDEPGETYNPNSAHEFNSAIDAIEAADKATEDSVGIADSTCDSRFVFSCEAHIYAKSEFKFEPKYALKLRQTAYMGKSPDKWREPPYENSDLLLGIDPDLFIGRNGSKSATVSGVDPFLSIDEADEARSKIPFDKILNDSRGNLTRTLKTASFINEPDMGHIVVINETRIVFAD